jgi:hypothetical protein
MCGDIRRKNARPQREGKCTSIEGGKMHVHKGRENAVPQKEENVHRQREKNVSITILTDHIFENLFAIRCFNIEKIFCFMNQLESLQIIVLS